MDIMAIRGEYLRTWVAAKVLRRDENGQPVDFEVLAVAPDRLTVREKMIN